MTGYFGQLSFGDAPLSGGAVESSTPRTLVLHLELGATGGSATAPTRASISLYAVSASIPSHIARGRLPTRTTRAAVSSRTTRATLPQRRTSIGDPEWLVSP